jgi:uncharacterized heparinase superfamily protein
MALDHSVPLASRWLLAGPYYPNQVTADRAARAGWPGGFTPLDLGLWCDGRTRAALRAGKLPLIGACHLVAPADDSGSPNWASADWEAASAPLLWRFHLYYWDWAWALATKPQRQRQQARKLFTALWESWDAAIVPGRWPAWHPYPAALRAWSWCGIYDPLAAGSTIDARLRAGLAAHAGFLRRNLETDVGGNHLLKNLKALTGLAVFFGAEAMLTDALGRLQRQLALQVLPDGGHYERAPAYHCQVLGDLIDISGLLRAAGRDQPTELPTAIEAMRAWLGAVLTPAGEVPLLNDGYPVSRELLAGLRPTPPQGGPVHLLPDTGLATATAGPWHLLADVGPPCPRELPAHAHADTLTCQVHVDSEPLLVDTGTSTYARGPVRDRERSTAAHNTLGVDGHDSTEVWGAFRAGRRTRVSGVRTDPGDDTGIISIEAAHDGYRNLHGRPRHHRRWLLRERDLRVEDTVTGRGRHRIVIWWHLVPDSELRLVPGGAVATAKAGEFAITVTATSEPVLRAATADVSTGFGCTAPAPVLVCTLHCTLPVQISTVWRRADPRQEPM